MEKIHMVKKAAYVLDGFLMGALASSASFYFVYGNWHPLVWSALAVSGISLLSSLVIFMDSKAFPL